MENNFLEGLEKYFKETPQEKILEDWKKSESMDNVGITVDEFLKRIKKNITKKMPKAQKPIKKVSPSTKSVCETSSAGPWCYGCSDNKECELYNKLH